MCVRYVELNMTFGGAQTRLCLSFQDVQHLPYCVAPVASSGRHLDGLGWPVEGRRKGEAKLHQWPQMAAADWLGFRAVSSTGLSNTLPRQCRRP